MKKIFLLILLAISIACLSQSDAGVIIGNWYAAGTWSTVWQVTNECTGVPGDSSVAKQNRNVVLAATSTGSGSKIRLTFEARSDASSYNFVTTCVYIGQRSSGDIMTSVTEITFNSGGHGFTISTNGGTIVSDEITFAFNTSNDYLVHLDNDADTYARWWLDDGDTECKYYYDYSASSNCTDTLDLASDGNLARVVGLQKIEAYN